MNVEFKTIKKAGKWAVEITDEGDGRFNIIRFEDNNVTDIIGVTKEEMESMMSFINRETSQEYKDIYRVHIKLGDGYYAKTTTLEEDFDTKEKALEWIKEKGLVNNGECGSGYSDGDGDWIVWEGILFKRNTAIDESKFDGTEYETYDQAYCSIEELAIKASK